ncbi:MAG TPA: MDR family MFS transporter [Candidatus Dormibacteraeota bacterium]|nr:MDR family MFS transporter [Candidatus Dormibacteraeota bacterium]
MEKETTARSAPSFGAGMSRNRIWLVFAGLVLAILMANLDNSIVNPALATIVGSLHGLQQMQWVITAYVLSSTIALPLYGKLGDLIGRKYLFLFAIGTFLAGSMLSGLSQNMTELIAFRAFQGMGAGGLMISAMAITGELVPPRARGMYMGVIMAVNSIGTVAGPLLGGFFTDDISWRWCFYVNVPIAIAAIAVTVVALPATGRVRGLSLDVVGAALLAAGSACLIFLTSWAGTKYDWGSWQILSLGAGFVVATILFVIAETRAAEPIIPLRLFRESTITLSAAIGLAIGFCMFGAVAFIPTFLQMVDGVSATVSGLLMLPLMGGVMVAATVAGRIVSSTGRYKVFFILGGVATAAGVGLLSLMSADSTRLENGIFMAVTGVGLGLVMSVMTTAVQNVAPRRDLGAATSTVNFFRQIGASLGTAVVGTLFTTRLTSNLAADLPRGASLHVSSISAITPAVVHHLPAVLRADFIHAYATALPPIFLYLVPIAAVAFVLAWFLREVPLRGGPATETAPAPAVADPTVRPLITVAAQGTPASRAVAAETSARLELPLLDLSAGPEALTAALRATLSGNPEAVSGIAGLVAEAAAGIVPHGLSDRILGLVTGSGGVVLDPRRAPASDRLLEVEVRAADDGDPARLSLDLGSLAVPTCVAVIVAAALAEADRVLAPAPEPVLPEPDANEELLARLESTLRTELARRQEVEVVAAG